MGHFSPNIIFNRIPTLSPNSLLKSPKIFCCVKFKKKKKKKKSNILLSVGWFVSNGDSRATKLNKYLTEHRHRFSISILITCITSNTSASVQRKKASLALCCFIDKQCHGHGHGWKSKQKRTTRLVVWIYDFKLGFAIIFCKAMYSKLLLCCNCFPCFSCHVLFPNYWVKRGGVWVNAILFKKRKASTTVYY